MDCTVKTSKNSVYYLGDIHGVFASIRAILTYANRGDSIVQVGDGHGIGFIRPQSDFYNINQLNESLKKAGVMLYFARGNHEVTGPHKDGIHGGYDFSKFSNIVFMKDFSIYVINGVKHGVINGAVSVDRCFRTIGKDYWPDEKVVDSEDYKSLVDIDILITHTVPDYFSPFRGSYHNIQTFLQKDPILELDLKAESNLMAKYVNYIMEKSPNLKNWFAGHFHKSHITDHDGINCQILDINEVVTL